MNSAERSEKMKVLQVQIESLRQELLALNKEKADEDKREIINNLGFFIGEELERTDEFLDSLDSVSDLKYAQKNKLYFYGIAFYNPQEAWFNIRIGEPEKDGAAWYVPVHEDIVKGMKKK